MDAPTISYSTVAISGTAFSGWRSILLWSVLFLTVPLLSVERFYAYNVLAVFGFYAYAKLASQLRQISAPSAFAAAMCWIAVLTAQITADVSQHVAVVGLRDSLRGAFCFLLPFALIRHGGEPSRAIMFRAAILILCSLILVHGFYAWRYGLARDSLTDNMDLFENRNLWAIAITASLLFGWVVALTAEGMQRFSLLFFVILAGGVLHYINPSRGALICSIVCAFFLLAVRFFKWRKIVTAVFFLLLLFLQLSYFMWLMNTDPVSYVELDVFSSRRLSIHFNTLLEIAADPWTGYGPRAFPELMHDRFLGMFDQHIASPHNLLLDAAFTFGIPMTLLCLLIVGRFISVALLSRLQSAPSFATLWSLALLSQLAVHGMQEGTLFRPYTLSALAVALALLSLPGSAIAIEQSNKPVSDQNAVTAS